MLPMLIPKHPCVGSGNEDTGYDDTARGKSLQSSSVWSIGIFTKLTFFAMYLKERLNISVFLACRHMWYSSLPAVLAACALAPRLSLLNALSAGPVSGGSLLLTKRRRRLWRSREI